MKSSRLVAGILFAAVLLFGCAQKPREEVMPEETEQSYENVGQAIPSMEYLSLFRIPNLGMEEGDAGRFSVNDYTAKLCTSGSNYMKSQTIVNETDSAWLYENLPGLPQVIADHYYQGFETIKTAIPGETLAYLTRDGRVTIYRCVRVYTDRENLEGDLVLSDGRIVQRDKGDGPLATYTCNDDVGISITVVYWEPLMTMSVIRQGMYNAQ